MASIRKLVESGLVTYLTGQSIGCAVYPGISVEDKAAPCVVCAVDSAQEEPLHSGNYHVNVTIQIAAPAEADSLFDDICEATKNAIWNDEFEALLQAGQPGLTVWGAAAPDEMQFTRDEDAWVATHKLVLYCAASDFT